MAFFQDQFNSILGLTSQVDNTGVPRNAMVFTSTLRGYIANRGQDQSGFITSNANGIFTPNPADIFYGSNIGSVQPNIAMRVNPKSIAFSQAKRISEKKTLGGTQFYFWNGPKGQNNDIMKISFKGNTGNISRQGSLLDPTAVANGIERTVQAADSTGAVAKLIAWQNLMLLTREPQLLSNGVENVFSIFYISALLPTLIEFRGHFNSVINFEESGDKPNSRDYSFDFTVTSTIPDMDSILGEIQTVLAAIQVQPNLNAQILGTTIEGNGTLARGTLVNL